MSRIRTIKPEFWTSEQVAECSPIARLLFIGMWNFADDAGNMPASCKTLKMQIFPGDDIAVAGIDKLVSELIENGLVAPYSSEGKGYWHITGWEKHQKIERPSYRHPKFISADTSKNVQRAVQDNSENDRRKIDAPHPPECNGMEGSNTDIPPSEKYPPQAAMPSPLDEDPKAVLFSAGAALIAEATGKSVASGKSTIGQMLKLAGGDAHASMVLGLLRDAKRERKADLVSWCMACLQERKNTRAPPSVAPVANFERRPTREEWYGAKARA